MSIYVKNTYSSDLILLDVWTSLIPRKYSDARKDKRLVIISISPNSHDDITRLIDDPIILDDLRTIILYISTLDDNITFHERLDRIYSYESTFDLNTIDGICKILNTIFKYETKLSR